MTDSSNAATVGDLFRSLGAIINKGAYFLLGLMYQIFFNVSSAQLFESETIKNFYGRVQLIIGVFMIFKLAVSILQGIMNPDKFTNPKEGFGNVITRIIISLALLTVLVPINVPNVESANSYEKYLNNNGLLFGTLYSLQDRILSNNTLGRLILGTTDDATSVTDEEAQDGMTEADKQNAKLEKSANVFASTILKGFLRINLLPEELRASDDESDPKNWYCGSNLSDEGKAAVNAYNKLDIEPSTLLSDDVVTVDCEINDNWLSGAANAASNIPFIGGLFENFGGKSRYVFAFEWVWAFIVGAIFLVIMVGFTVDIAIRSIKLAILRLIAPIPVISYIEPSSSKNGGMFSSWVKALTSTYLDLFLRLAIVYFVIFLIQDMIVNGIVINEAGGMVGIISCIFIWIGLFFFAKMAPKFIKDALGLKGSMTNVGLSGILGGAAMVAGGGGLKGAALGMMQGADAAVTGEASGKPVSLGSAWSQNRDLMAKIRTGDKDARGGFMGKAMDRLNYATRERRAQMLGIGNKDLADADYAAKFAQQEAQEAQQEYDMLKSRYDRNDGSVTDAQLRAAYEKNQAFQTAAAKAKSNYDKMDKDRGLMGVAPRVSDKRDTKYRVRQKLNNTFGTNFVTSKQDSADRWNDRLGLDGNEHIKFQGGTYRSPQKTTNDPYDDAAGIGVNPTSTSDIMDNINGHERDLKNFNGTTDDEGIFRH